MICVRHASQSELGQVLDWAAAEGWNPGLDDAGAFYAADPLGFFVACEDATPIAAVSVVNHNDDFAFLGLYIVRPTHRARGIGISLWNHAIQHAEDRMIGLDGVPDQQENYTASGFKHQGATTRFIGAITAQAMADAKQTTDKGIPALIDQEARVSGARKEAYLAAWFANTVNRQTILLNGGFATVRRCRDGAKIGPLYAPEPQTAQGLIRHAASLFGPVISIDVPGTALPLAALCRDLGMEPGFETARMYRGGEVAAADASYFAVASLELG